MTAHDQIVAYLSSHHGLAYCDDCLSRNLAIRPRQAVQQKTFKLAQEHPFERRQMRCSGCGETTKLAIRKRIAERLD
jgi:hypothetical protein